MGFFPEERPTKPAKKAPEKGAGDHDEELFQLLRRRRKEIADRDGVPPYVVFSDKSLVDMSSRLPVTREAFSAVYGVGAKKMETYADVFIGLIAEFLSRRTCPPGPFSAKLIP
jgi:ATP-dependent DNA helicase RecQ